LSYLTVLKPGISSIQDEGSHFTEEALIAVTGAVGEIYVNNEQVKAYRGLYIPKNSIVSFGVVENGIYGYMSIQGGVKTSKVLDSRSWFSQITEYTNFFKDLTIPYQFNQCSSIPNARLVSNLINNLSEIVEVYPGPEFGFLTPKQQNSIVNTVFKPSVNRNRMGVQLESDFYEHEFSILSSPVLPGTVQWTPSGKLIVLMNDAQTIGGYPRLFQLSKESLNKLSQLNKGFNFEIKH